MSFCIGIVLYFCGVWFCMTRSPIVEVSDSNLDEFTDVQIGSRVRAALAHTPVVKYGNYQAILVAKDSGAVSKSADDILDVGYDVILNQRIIADDEWRSEIGSIVREKLSEESSFVLARS